MKIKFKVGYQVIYYTDQHTVESQSCSNDREYLHKLLDVYLDGLEAYSAFNRVGKLSQFTVMTECPH